MQLVHLLLAIIVLGVGGACFGTSAVFCRAKGLILHESALFAHWLRSDPAKDEILRQIARDTIPLLGIHDLIEGSYRLECAHCLCSFAAQRIAVPLIDLVRHVIASDETKEE